MLIIIYGLQGLDVDVRRGLISNKYNLGTTYNLLPTSYHLQPTSYHLQPTSYHLLTTTYHLQPTKMSIL